MKAKTPIPNLGGNMARRSRGRRASRGNVWTPILVLGGVALVVGLILIARGRPGALDGQSSAERSYPEIPRVEVDDARAAHDSGEAVFVDVRDADSYRAGHIPGAVSIPLPEVEGRLAELEPSAWYIPY
jgi:hypothetical protein